MRRSAMLTSIPPGSEIERHLSGAHFHDSYQVPVLNSDLCALETYLVAVSTTPAWVDLLMALRNLAVRLAGLKDLGSLGAIDASKPAAAYRVGDRVGIFVLLHLHKDEIILGDSDTHLDVKVSVCKLPVERGHSIVASTVVHVHNWIGRLYMLPVMPVHKLIVPTLLSNMARLRREDPVNHGGAAG